VVAGALKVVYDLLFLAMFRNRRPPEEIPPVAVPATVTR
jgi:hypothetical protein